MPPKKASGKPGRPPKSQAPVEPVVPKSSPVTQAVMDTMVAFSDKFQEFATATLADLEALHNDFVALHQMVMGITPAAHNGAVSTTKTSVPEPEPEPESESEAQQETLTFEDMSVGDLQEVIDHYNLDVDLATIKGLAAKQAAVEDAYLDRSESENTPSAEEASEPAPDFTEMTKKELQDFIDLHDLDVDLKDYKRLAEMQEAVEEAYSGVTTNSDDDDSNDWPEN